MSKSSSENRRQSNVDNSTEWKPITEVENLQKDMLRVLRQSSVDPVSYVGLEYCGPKRCGRVGCSEACWYGTLRRRIADRQAACQLLRQHGGKVYDVDVIRTKWEWRYGELHEVNIRAGNNLVRRVLDKFVGSGIIAVGTLKVRPIGFTSGWWRGEVHIIVAGANNKEVKLMVEFGETPVRIVPDVVVTPVNNIKEAVDDALNANERARLADSFRVRQRQEFYSWLLNMKIGSRLIRYGCDEEFKPLAGRKSQSRT
jgi:hypothetical protein